MRVIPAIDLTDGKCVRLFQGDFEQTTEYSNDPLAIANQFAELKTRDLHIVDLDGARTGAATNRDMIAKIAANSTSAVQVGGGIRDTRSLLDWLDRGIDRCVVGSLAVSEPATVIEWFDEFGAGRIVLALDVSISDSGLPYVATHGWQNTSRTTLWECIDRYLDSGLQHVLCTDISRDGALAGPNIDLYGEIINRYPGLQLQASGGVRDAADLQALRDHGIPAAITGRALLDGRITPAEVASFQQSA